MDQLDLFNSIDHHPMVPTNPPAPKPKGELIEGDRVQLFGLTGPMTDLNGKAGEYKGIFERFCVVAVRTETRGLKDYYFYRQNLEKI